MKIQRWLRQLANREKTVNHSKSDWGFVDLTPSDRADFDGTYSKALEFALNNDRIRNIALTGPFGSGKSSIIKTFEKNNRGKYSFLNISLASFKEDSSSNSDDESQNRLVERSILQQIFYGEDANNLPYSRFKKISSPEHSLIKSFIFVVWASSAYGLYQYKSELLNIDLYSNIGWLLYVLIALVFAMPVISVPLLIVPVAPTSPQENA